MNFRIRSVADRPLFHLSKLVHALPSMGPGTIAPDAWVISGARFLPVPDVDPAAILAAAAALAVDGTKPTVIIGRE